MKTDMNHPAVSKINWTALVIQFVGIAAVLGWLPDGLEQPLTEATMILGPALIQIFRTWFTEPGA